MVAAAESGAPKPPDLGTPVLNSVKLAAPTLPNPNPENDAQFLRFPANAAPGAGPNKVRVGAQ